MLQVVVPTFLVPEQSGDSRMCVPICFIYTKHLDGGAIFPLFAELYESEAGILHNCRE